MKTNRRKLPPAFANFCVPHAPVEFMLMTMNDEAQPIQLRAEMAKCAAPYVHHRRAAVDSVAPAPRYAFDLNKLNEDELVALERMMAKAQTEMPAEDDADAEDAASGQAASPISQ